MNKSTTHLLAAKDWRYERHQGGHYKGQELQPNSARPGAMDAYGLPSLVAGVRTARVMPLCAPTTTKTTTSAKYSS